MTQGRIAYTYSQYRIIKLKDCCFVCTTATLLSCTRIYWTEEKKKKKGISLSGVATSRRSRACCLYAIIQAAAQTPSYTFLFRSTSAPAAVYARTSRLQKEKKTKIIIISKSLFLLLLLLLLLSRCDPLRRYCQSGLVGRRGLVLLTSPPFVLARAFYVHVIAS